ncbi:Cilia- and flagella-associated protein 74, partial [Geodia barretti]
VQVTNRGKTALRVAFVLPPELTPHLEISPPHSLIQGASSFSAQLKFLPLPGIFADCDKYFEGDCLKVPAEIRVVDQVLPVPYSIRARVATSDLVFSSSDIDFGTCTLHESVVATLSITNTSILPQEFGFVHLPDCVDVQPNDGFGTILPQETISLDLIFSANKPRDYSFELTCLTHLNRSFKISCKGRGVLPSLKLPENVVNFSATPLNSLITARISITNTRLGRLSSAVIRGAVLPQGPKVFEFSVPDGVPMEISPRVGTIDLDESVSIELSYTPSLPVTATREEALRLATEAARIGAREGALAAQQRDQESASTPEQKKGSRAASRGESQKKKRKGKGEVSSSGRESEVSGRKSGGDGGGTDRERSSQIQQGKTEGTRSDKDDCSGEEGVKVDVPEEGSETWRQAVANLLNGFQNWTHQFSVPCFVSSAAPTSELDTVPYRPEDTLYVEVRVPVVKPSLLILSNGGNSTIDFSSVATGDYLTKHLTVKNISDSSIQLMSSPLDPRGPFYLRNALRSVPPSSTHTLSLRFSPSHGGRFYEVMKLSHSESGGTDLRLIGEAVEPRVVLEPDSDGMDFGHTYTGDTNVRKFQLKNTCSLGVRYNIELLGRNDVKGAKFRAANYSGKPVFDCIPFQGRIEPESVAEFQVIFSPDHQSAHYSDTLTININDSPTHTLKLAGQACSSMMYITGSDNQTEAEFHSMAAGMPSLGPDGEPVEPVEPVLVLFDERAGEGGGDVVKRELEIGCIKSATVKKNTGDFTIEAIPPSNPHSKTFTFDPTKGTVEAGSTKTVAISFHPPQSAVKDGIIQANTNIILKGETTRTCKLLLRAITAD